MPKKRRKLSKELEQKISSAKRDVELILAKITDIDEEDIQTEYMIAFQPIRDTIAYLDNLYIQEGITEQSEAAYLIYTERLKSFNDEYET